MSIRTVRCRGWACFCLALLISHAARAAGAAAPLPAAAPSSAEATLLGQLEAFDRRLVSAERHVAIAEANRHQAEATLAQAQAAQATAQLAFAQRSRALARRLGAALRAVRGARWALLGGSATVGDYLARQRLLDAVARHDQRLWQARREAKQRLEAATAFAEQVRAQLLAAEHARRGARDLIAGRRRQRSERLARLRRDRQARAALRQEQLGAGQALQQTCAAALQGRPGTTTPFAALRGRLPWPAEGPVRKAFGQRIELTYGTATAHNGLDIAAPAGAPVAAVAPGTVVFADWLRGYGQVVIVDHADGYHTVSAHLARTLVAPGERVAAHQRLGQVGDTGSLRGTLLYFEVRRKGLPQDPRPWLRGDAG